MMTPKEEAEYDAMYAKGGRDSVYANRFGKICHSFVTDGRIQYLGDCTHGLDGQAAEVPE
ncbi:hypothetical protein [Pseudomonas sp. JUb42]|uniref:hypothetical protein n=1 Tax=Pseudomonas sp. JUb42 TaxID=2940611 RepID=UPI002168F3CB|nr:hypothetical protein [Pseudomonas sp. JUb42]